jgi:multicomponent Na+:H+ antiporter subunit A
MLVAVLSGFLLSFLAIPITRVGHRLAGWVIALLPLVLTIYFGSFIQQIQDGDIVSVSYDWVPSLNVNLSFYLDGLSLLFALLITGVGTIVVIYASGYLAKDPQLERFYVYILVFMASMLGVVLANNVITLFVFWELTSISSFLLISYYHTKSESREAATQALLVTGSGGLAMLAGLVLLGLMSGTWEISELVNARATILDHHLYLPMLILVVIGAFTKSAQFPFHFWLPNAMEAPAPVSTYLHSATMVKAGIYLLARLTPSIGGTDEWQVIVTAAGGITMVLGGYMAWQQTDVKRILAYTTISALGIIVFLLGVGSGTAIEAAMLFIIVHALYKGALFMVGGAIDHETGTRDITQLGGLRSVMPFTALGAGVAALSMSGIPPLLGFIGKEVVYEATQHAEKMPVLLLTAVAIVANLFNVTAAGMVTIRPFLGQPTETPKKAHEAPLSMWLGPIVLGVLSITFGILSVQLLEPLLLRTVEAVYGKHYEIELGLWHGLNVTLLLSAITIAGGIALYLNIDRLRSAAHDLDFGARFGPSAQYKRFFSSIIALAELQSVLILKTVLRYYIRIIISTFMILVGYVLITEADFSQLGEKPTVRFYELGILIIIVAGALITTQVRSKLAAVAALGTVGYGVALLYIVFGAPDLAMTQFSIETLTVVLFMLVIYRLPGFNPVSHINARLRDGIFAGMVGAIMTILVLIITAEPLQSRLTPFFAENSYVEAKGHNVVNVILVDFRGFDTMGEITVLSVAAIGVFALLNLRLHDVHNDHAGDGLEDEPEPVEETVTE